MSESRIELVRRGYEAWNQGDRQWVLEHMSEKVEWISPPEDPDPGTYRGYAGVEQFWTQWRTAVGQLHFHPEEMFEVGDHVVVVALRSGVGESSGLSVSDHVVQVFSFEGDKCVRVHEFYDREEAVRSVRAEASADPAEQEPVPGSERD